MDPSSLYCHTCGALNAEDAQTCFACGTTLLADAPVEQQESAPKEAGARPAQLKPDQLLRQRYRILKQIGEGGFGAVYRAEDTEAGNRLVAIKEMQPGGLSPLELLEATETFHREARFLAELSHPSLPQICAHFSEGGNWYLVMDFIKGETLEDAVARQGGHLPVEKVLQIGIALCDVLEYLHTRRPPIIFRDLKPGNVMLTPDDHLYLIDFGIARHFKPGKARDTIAFGSPGYAAPEQYGKAQTTPRSDIYSLGALLHFLLSGTDPANNPFRFLPLRLQAPAGLAELIAQMLDLDEHKRPPLMRTVRDELERLLGVWTRSHQPVAAAASARTLASASPQVVPPVRPVAAPAQSSSKKGARFSFSGWPKRVLFVVVVLLACGCLWVFKPARTTTILCACGNFPGTEVPVVRSAYTVAWSPDSTRLAAGVGQTIYILDASTRRILLRYPGHNKDVDWIAWSPDGTRIASAGFDNTVQVWSADTGKLIFYYSGHTARVSELAWSPDGTRIASASDDTTVQVWNAADGSGSFIYRDHSTQVWTVAWSPDGKDIASGSQDGNVRVWEATTGVTQIVYHGQSDAIQHLAWSPDGKRIASASNDSTVQVWDVATGTTLVTYRGHTAAATALAWSPDGQRLVSGSYDETIQVWSAADGAQLSTFGSRLGRVWEVAWSPDGKDIASATANGTVHVWETDTGASVWTDSYWP